MNAIFFLIGCSVLVASLFLGAFLWAHFSGQNDDLYTPSVRILMDDEEVIQETEPELLEIKSPLDKK